MNRKKLLIFGLLMILTISSLYGVYSFLSENVDYQNVKLSENCSIDIPISNDISNYTMGEATKIYNDTKHDTFVAYFNTQSDGSIFGLIGDAATLAAMRDSYKIGSKMINISNTDVWYNEDTGYYMTFIPNNITHDNILIVTKNKQILTHIINSIKFNLDDKTSTDAEQTNMVYTYKNTKSTDDKDVDKQFTGNKYENDGSYSDEYLQYKEKHANYYYPSLYDAGLI